MFSANVHFHGLKISLRFETILANIGKLVHMGVFHMGKDFLFGTFSKATLGAFPKARVMPIGLLDNQLVHSPSMLLIETFHMICSKENSWFNVCQKSWPFWPRFDAQYWCAHEKH